MNIIPYAALLCLLVSQNTNVSAQINQPSQEVDFDLTIIKTIQANHPDSAYQISLNLKKQINQRDHFSQLFQLCLEQAKILTQIGQEKEALAKLQQAKHLLTDQNNPVLETKLRRALVTCYLSIRDKTTARTHLTSLSQLARQINDPSSLAAAFLYEGYLLSTPDSSIVYYENALNFSQIAKDTVLTAKIYANLGLLYYLKKADYDQSISYYENSIDLENINHKPGLVISYMRLSSVLRRQENYEQSITYNLKAINAAEESHFVRGMIGAYANMGNAYSHLQRFQDGLDYRKRAAQKAIEYGMYSSLPSIYNNIGASFVESQPDSALYYLNQCGYYSTQVNDLENLGISNLNIAEVYKKRGQYVEAEDAYKTALEALERGSYTRHIGYARSAFVKFYLEWSQESAELRRPIDYQKMQSLLDDAAPHMISQGDFDGSELLYKSYIELYSAQNNTEATSHYRGELISLRDSLIDNTNIDSANEWAEKLKTAEKEKEIVQLEADNRVAQLRNRLFQFALLATVIFFSILGYLYRKYLRQRNEKLRIEEAQQFRSKLSSNLHDDVGSVLSNLSLQSQIASLSATAEQKEELDSIAVMSQEAMDSLRDTVWAIDARKDKYENLVDRMIEYAERSLRYKDMSLVLQKNQWDGQTAIDPEKRQNIYLIFKEAIANIIKHSTGDQVILSVDQSSTHFKMSIHDDGTPDPDQVSDGSGLGNMKMRAESIGGRLSTSQQDGFAVSLEVAV